MTDFNQKTHDTDVGSHGGQSRQMMECSAGQKNLPALLLFLRVTKYRHPVCKIMYIASVNLCLEDI